MGQSEHAQELGEEGSVSWLQLPFVVLHHSPATGTLHECYRVTHYLHYHHEAVKWVQRTNQSALIDGWFIVIV